MTITSDPKHSRLLAAWHAFMEKISNIRGRQRTLLSNFDHSLTDREIEKIRKQIQKP